ncbi:MAG: signal peptide peptidase SppA [Planctomycetaceae bacterium]|nr:signal peptide peptidase SppA [Planctomycetaceae bacterium]
MKNSLLACCLLLLPNLVSAADETAVKAPPAETKTRKTGRAVIPVIEIRGQVTEKPVAEDLPFSFGGVQSESLLTILQRLEKARTDSSVPAIVLKTDNAVLGRAQSEELVRALHRLREAGKQVHVHTELFTTAQLALIGHATDLSMVPTGYMFITGMYGEQVFLRGLLDKIGVVPDYFTCGDYKSAGEMFMRTEPSAESAEMTTWLFDGLYAALLKSVSRAREVTVEQAEEWIDAGVFTAEAAADAGIIDVVEHQQQFEDRLRKKYGDNLKFDRRYGRKSGTRIDLSSPFGILNFYAELLSPPSDRRSTTPAVGIVYLEGAIMPGSSGGNPFLEDAAAFSDPIRKALDEAAEDDAVKAVVFRVNSPGGSAVASEVILNATRRIAAKKPFVVSMGDVAGSGGYYVACGTDTIFAEESTITGSIGVVVGKFATTGMWDKLGISFQPVRRGKNAAMLSSAAVFSDSERTAIRGYMDEVYEVFKGHVTSVRGDRLKKPIDDLAGGRVYTGQQALELGLVDRIGGLSDAIAEAARLAKLEEGHEVRIIPRPKNFMELLMSDLSGPKDDGKHLSLDSRVRLPQLKGLESTIVPLLNTLDPARSLALRQAVLQLLILQQERTSLTMPIFASAGDYME